MSEQRHLKYSSIDDLIADLQQLQKGYRQLGNWTLPHAAWHLSLALRSLQPLPAGAASTPEQVKAKQERLDYLLAGNEMGAGRPVPPGLDPLKDFPADADATAVDNFITGLKKLAVATQPTVMFGRFGLVTIDEFRRFILLHTAHHLNKLIPTT